MSELRLDLHAALRGLLRAPAFTAAVIATLGLGTGAATAMFSVLRATLLRPAPFPGADRLVVLSLAERTGGRTRQGGLTTDAIALVESHAASFVSVGAYTNPNFNVTGFDKAERVAGEVVSVGYLPTLGVAPAAGRWFRAGEDSVTGAAPVVVLGHALWLRRFGGDPAVIGKRIRLNRVPLEVVGVMPAGFRGVSGEADLWIPRAMAPVVAFPYRSFTVIARLRPAVSLTEARAEFELLAARYAAGVPETGIGVRRFAEVTPLNEARVDAGTRTPVLVLLGAVGFLLLIACANVASLLLARGVGREREVAIRLAIGSGPWALARLVLTECALLAAAGAAVGVLLGYVAIGAVRPLLPLRPPGAAFLSVGEFADPRLDLWVLAACFVTTVATVFFFGLAPVLRAARIRPADTLRAGGTGRAGRDLYALLTVSETALAAILLTGAGLLLRSLWRLESLPLGFRTEQVTAFQVQAPLQWTSGTGAGELVDRVTAAVVAVPGVAGAAATYYGPFSPGARHRVRFPGETDEVERWAGHHYVTPGYFALLDIPLRRGRYLKPADRASRPRVAVLSEQAAGRYFPGQDPVGKRFFIGAPPDAPPDSLVEVVGVVGDVRYRPGPFPAEPDVYTAYGQSVANVWAQVLVRSAVPGARLVPELRTAVASVDPDLGLSDAGSLADLGADQLARRRLNALLLSAFAVLALALAGVGVYGVMAHQAAQRTREFGIRLAVGATGGSVAWLVLRRAAVLVGAGLAAGLVGAWWLTRVLSSQLYQVSPGDPLTFGVIAGILGAVALAASYLPARRASRVDPVVALRD